MEIIKNEKKEELGNVKGEKSIDNELVAQLEEKFDLMNQQLQEKKYALLLESQGVEFLTEFFDNVKWTGYESYAIDETYRVLNESINNDSIDVKFKPEIIEAVFHFMKKYEGRGIKFASNHKYVCDQLSVTINEINKDRQELQGLSLELIAAQHGITVEEVIQKMNDGQNQ